MEQGQGLEGRGGAWGTGCQQLESLATLSLLPGLSPSAHRPGVLKEPKLMGAVSFFVFFFTLLALARQVSHRAP